MVKGIFFKKRIVFERIWNSKKKKQVWIEIIEKFVNTRIEVAKGPYGVEHTTF